MHDDSFADLSLEEIQAAERKYRAKHPVLWRVAEFVMFVREPWQSVRGWVAAEGDRVRGG